jgi:hypothetical protein
VRLRRPLIILSVIAAGNNRKLSQTGLITKVASQLQIKNRPGIMSQWQAKQSFHCTVESIELDEEVHRREPRILHDVLRFADHMGALHVYSNETTGGHPKDARQRARRSLIFKTYYWASKNEPRSFTSSSVKPI